MSSVLGGEGSATEVGGTNPLGTKVFSVFAPAVLNRAQKE